MVRVGGGGGERDFRGCGGGRDVDEGDDGEVGVETLMCADEVRL